MKDFAHLHLHTEYSLLDGLARIKNLFLACHEKNIKAVAMTDHGNMYGTLQFLNCANEFAKNYSKTNGLDKTVYPVKPIIGSEFYYVKDINIKDNRTNPLYHLVLIAKNIEGYHNLAKLSSYSHVEGSYIKPRICFEQLEKFSGDLICLTGCLAGYIPQLLLNGDKKSAEEHALALKKIFKDDLYIEIQNHNLQEQASINPLLVELSNKLNIKLVATNDVHYINKEDSEAQDVMMCIQMGKKLSDENRLKFPNDEFYLKTYDEMYEKLGWCEAALANTLEIADKCELITFKKENRMPKFKLTEETDYIEGENVNEYFRRKCYAGLKNRYGELNNEVIERAEMELDVITSMGFADYYLIVSDFIQKSRDMDIPVGAGRGSGVGSILAYALKITNVEPLKYGLIFERFLNKERVSNPDFDIDFCYERRSEVINYVVEKYGKPNVSQIVTFGTLKAKQAIKDVARVYDMPLRDVEVITKMITGTKTTINDVLGRTVRKPPKEGEKEEPDPKVPEFVDLYENDDFAKRVIDMAIKLENMPRNTSVHAAGVVICDRRVDDYVPLCKNGQDITTQYDKKEVEAQGLLKMDFLALKTLTDVKKCTKYIKEIHGIDIDFDALGYDDIGTYELIGSGDTDAVFQLESPGMKKFMEELKPTKFEEIIAGISLYRPGPMDSIPDYIKNKLEADKLKYMNEDLKSILEVTYGVIVYQEQVMAIVRKLAGFSYGKADKLRKAMGDKKKEILLEQRTAFLHGCPAMDGSPAVVGCEKNNLDLSVCDDLYGKMVKFGEYAFNKSHAAAYAVLAYQTAYLKKYYPIEFIASVMNNRINNIDDISKYINYLKMMKTEKFKNGVKILKPSINKSKSYFYPEALVGIRFGLVAIKGVGEKVIEDIIKEREYNGEYKNFEDFLKRANSFINKKNMENLIMGGAFDEFGHTRATLLNSYENGLSLYSQQNKIKNTGQYSMFDLFEEEIGYADNLNYTVLKEYDIKDILSKEKDILGIYLSGHPLDDYREFYSNLEYNIGSIKLEAGDGEDFFDDEENSATEKNTSYEKYGSVYGILQNIEKRYDKSNREMYRGSIEDLYGTLNFVVFSRNATIYKSLLVNDNIVKLTGKINNLKGLSMNVDMVDLWNANTQTEVNENKNKVLYLKLKLYGQTYNKISEILNEYKGGDSKVIFVEEVDNIKKAFKYNHFVYINNNLLNDLKMVLDNDCIVVK